MRSLRLMLAVFALAVAGVAPAHARELIVGGTSAPPGSWPSIVALVQPLPATPSATQFCGGTLIDVQAVLTAGHCVNDGAGGVMSPASLDVLVGITDLGAPAASYQRIHVSSIERHPSFDGITLDNDVAILHLAETASTGQVMDLAAPTDATRWEAGDAAQIAGWGLVLPPSNPAATAPDALQQADVKIVADASCSSAQSYGPVIFNPSLMVCAGLFGVGGVDACNGDSGGPLVVTGLNGTKVLVGATSFTDSAHPCGDPNFPAVYSRLSALRSFVYAGLSPPGQPSQPSAVATSGGASLSWSPPAAPGGRAIAGYRITTRVNGNPVGTVDRPANPASAVITGLACATTYTFTVTAANAVGLGSASAPSNALSMDMSPPSNTGLPVVGGTAGIGKVLTASSGGWLSCSPTSYAYQWLADRGSGVFQPIAGQNGPQYVVTPSDAGARLRVRVTATNGFGATPADATPTAPVPPVPLNLAAPVTTGYGRVGKPLSASAGTWNVTDGITYQWSRETAPGSGVFVPIAGATAATYIPSAPDVRSRLRVVVTVTNASGSATATSNAVMARPRFRVVSTTSPKVALTSVDLATVALRLQAEPRTRLAIRIVDPAGAIRTPISKSSRIDGAAPRVVTRRLTARLGTSSIHPITVAFRGRSRGTLRTVRIVIVATSTLGERAETTVRARVRL